MNTNGNPDAAVVRQYPDNHPARQARREHYARTQATRRLEAALTAGDIRPARPTDPPACHPPSRWVWSGKKRGGAQEKTWRCFTCNRAATEWTDHA